MDLSSSSRMLSQGANGVLQAGPQRGWLMTIGMKHVGVRLCYFCGCDDGLCSCTMALELN